MWHTAFAIVLSSKIIWAIRRSMAQMIFCISESLNRLWRADFWGAQGVFFKKR